MKLIIFLLLTAAVFIAFSCRVFSQTGTYSGGGDGSSDHGTGTDDFSSELVDLAPGTTYYVRAYATNYAGTGYGPQEQLNTKTGLKLHNTDSDIDGKSDMEFGANPTPDPGKTVVEMGFRLSSDYAGNNDVADIVDSNAPAAGFIRINWDEYTYGSHYFCRYYIKYSNGSYDFGPVYAFEKNEGSGIIQIGE